MTHTINAAPGEPALLFTLAGEEKMPLPMIKPTTSDSPLRYVKLLFLSKLCVTPSKCGVLGVPREVYPGPDVDRGKRVELKSNALETEYDRSPRRGRLGVKESSNESFLEEGVPEAEDSKDSRPSLLDARDWSSRESRWPGG